MLPSANISLSGVQCSAPGHSALRLGPELAGTLGVYTPGSISGSHPRNIEIWKLFLRRRVNGPF